MAKQLCSIIVVLVFASVAFATPDIDAAANPLDYIIGMNMSGQDVYVFATGGDAVQGMELNITVGGGASGPTIDFADVPTGGPTDGGVDVITGTIFDGNNGGGFDGYVNSYDAYKGVVTDTGTVSANGLVATIALDATGFNSYGTYAFSLTNAEGDTNFAGISANLTDGQYIVTIQGDANGDGHVTLADLTILATFYGITPQGNQWRHGDFNDDKVVSLADLTILATNYGNSAPGAPVPEPVSLSLLAIGGFALLRRKR